MMGAPAELKPVRSLTNVRTTTTKSRQFGASSGSRESIASSTGVGSNRAFPGKYRKASQMNKYTSLLTAAIASLFVGLGLATASNAQSPTRAPMSDQDYCQSLVKAFHESIRTLHQPPLALPPPTPPAPSQTTTP